MRDLIFGLVAAAVSGLIAMGHPALAGDILTITGSINVTNRAPYEPFTDAFFKHHDVTFKRAFAFDRAALAKLPQHEVQANVEGWPAAITAKGPLLKDALKAAGVRPDATVTIMSLDGYAVEFNPADRTAHDWVVATEVNGKELGIGGRGPIWMMYDTGGRTIEADAEEKWIWSAFLMTAK